MTGEKKVSKWAKLSMFALLGKTMFLLVITNAYYLYLWYALILFASGSCDP